MNLLVFFSYKFDEKMCIFTLNIDNNGNKYFRERGLEYERTNQQASKGEVI